MVDPPSNSEINVAAALARIEGRLDNLGAEMTSSVRLLAEQMKSGDERASQVIELLRQQQTFHTADLGKLDAVVRENQQKQDNAISVVRVDVEKQISGNRARIDALDERVDALRLSWARAGGLAAGAGLFASVATVAIVKALGL